MEVDFSGCSSSERLQKRQTLNFYPLKESVVPSLFFFFFLKGLLKHFGQGFFLTPQYNLKTEGDKF